MADRRVRDLQRRAQQGDAEAGGELLWERVRQGDLDEESIRLAAFLGHAHACAALGRAPDGPADLELLSEGLLERPARRLRIERRLWDAHELLVRASLAGARAVLPQWRGASPEDTRWEPLVAAVEACLAQPSDEGARAAAEAGGRVLPFATVPAAGRRAAAAACLTAFQCSSASALLIIRAIRELHACGLPEARSLLDRRAGLARCALEAAAGASSPAAVLAAVRNELCDWALRPRA